MIGAKRRPSACEPPRLERIVEYRPERARALGAVDVPEDRQAEMLERLGFGVERGEPWRIEVPSWRRDVDGAADIVEEVVRIHGYDKVEAVPLPRAPGVARPTATAEQKIERKVRRTAAARGLNEAVTWSFIAEDEAAPFGGSAWILDNPISEDMKAMRRMYGQLAATNYDYIGIGLLTAAIYFLLGLPIARLSRLLEGRLAYMKL